MANVNDRSRDARDRYRQMFGELAVPWPFSEADAVCFIDALNAEESLNAYREFVRSVSMAKGKHTPGPWKVIAWEDDSDHSPFCVVAAGKDSTTVRLIADDIFQVADANLIAATPDLLEACEKVLRDVEYMEAHDDGWWWTDSVMGETIDQVKAAIAKAKGEADGQKG